jgi:predicted methyltransferase
MALDTSKLGQGGSLPLSDLDQLIGQSTGLKQEVSAALAKINKTEADVICAGNRFPSQWVNLGGMRAAPYICDFSGSWLTINATVTVTGPNGQVYDTITPAAMANATKVSETNPTWKWTKTAPADLQ